jgi:hypothetical protein
MVDDRIILELGASVPIFRKGPGDYGIDPPGRFDGAVLKTERGYESYRYPPASKTGEPIATSSTLAEAVDSFMLRRSDAPRRPASLRFGNGRR